MMIANQLGQKRVIASLGLLVQAIHYEVLTIEVVTMYLT